MGETLAQKHPVTGIWANPSPKKHPFIGKHLFERTQYYNQATNIIVADNKSKKDIYLSG